MEPPNIIVPGMEHTMTMNIAAFVKIADYVKEHENDFIPGDRFTITGTDGKKLVIFLK